MNLPHVSHHRCPVISAQGAQLQERRSVLRELPWWQEYHERWHANSKRKKKRALGRGPFLHPLQLCLSSPRSLEAPIVCLEMETLLAGYRSVRLRLSLRLVGTSRSDDGDGNENVKIATRLITKTIIFHVHHAFLNISLPSLHDYDVKMPNFTFYRGSTQTMAKFPRSSVWTWIWSLGIQLQEGSPIHLTKLVTWSNRDEDWKNANSLFQRRFRRRELMSFHRRHY